MVDEPMHVLSEQNAKDLFAAAEQYYGDNQGLYIRGAHRTEIFAQELIHRGDFKAAQGLMHLHDIMREFAKGNFEKLDPSIGYKAITTFITDNIEDDKLRKNTLEQLLEPIKTIEAIVYRGNPKPVRTIDWEASKAILEKVKEESFPESNPPILANGQTSHAQRAQRST